MERDMFVSGRRTAKERTLMAAYWRLGAALIQTPQTQQVLDLYQQFTQAWPELHVWKSREVGRSTFMNLAFAAPYGVPPAPGKLAPVAYHVRSALASWSTK